MIRSIINLLKTIASIIYKGLKYLASIGLKYTLVAIFTIAVVSTSLIGFEQYLYTYKGKSVVMLTKSTAKRSGGTGFQVLTPSGKQYTLSNAHVCRGSNQLIAFDHKKESHVLKVIELDVFHDLCILEPISHLPALDVAKEFYVHERIWLVGHPALRPLTLESGHYAGNLDMTIWEQCPIGICVVKRNANYINNIAYGGNSGSPVLDMLGNVVGVLFAGRPDQPTASYTVPLYAIKRFLKNK